ncbi:MAG: DNA repair protein RadA, partial [Clostridia bacterium]|nr:DNA repair protein RadA [Clostridia bacterium]
MAKATTQFVCNECGYVSPRWLGKCPGCEKFNTFIEEVVAPTPTAKTAKTAAQLRASSAKAIPVNAVQRERLTRIKSGMAEFDNVLGGGIVPASLVLIGGDPGVGKS